MSTPSESSRQNTLDVAVAIVVVAFGVAVSLFSLRNNDIWWMLGTARRIVDTHAFIYTDPFTFTLSGHPWSPQAYLSAIVFYLFYSGAGAAGLIALRAVLVAATLVVSLRTLARTGVSWASSGLLVVVVILVAQTRFIVRAHLFEYLFIALTMGFLLTSHRRRGRWFYVAPALVQLLWTNMHPSFLLGPALYVLFFAGEWIGERTPVGALRPLHRHDWRRVGILVAVVVAACFVNPNPAAFLAQPFGGEQRALISHFTLEWKSPFDPSVAAGNFHPYYEILLGIAVLAVLVSLRRLPLAAVLPMAATAYLSLRSHRFRVEFALTALPLVCVLLRDAPIGAWLRARLGGARSAMASRALPAVAVVVLVVLTAPSRVEVGKKVAVRYPDRALAFVVHNDVAHRPFNPIGFGSYMVWDLYGQRQTFIDGRNFDPTLYRDFLSAQANRAGLDHAIATYRLDAFILPALENADAGMTNIHKALSGMKGWSLVHMDPVAYVYVSDATVDSTWVAQHAYRAYHPLTLSGKAVSGADGPAIAYDLERAVAESPDYATLWQDLGMVRGALGDGAGAVEALEHATRLDPGNAAGWNRLGNAAMLAGKVDEAIDAFEHLAAVVPGDVRPYLSLARALATAGRYREALERVDRALAIDAGNKNALELRGQIQRAMGEGNR